MDNTQPGQVIMPNLPEEPKPAGDGAPEPERPIEAPAPQPIPAPAPTPTPTPDTSLYSPAQDYVQTQPGTVWGTYEDAPQATPLQPQDGIRWTASEFIDHDKNAGWYTKFGIIGLLVSAVVYFITKDLLSTGVVVFAMIAFGVFAARKPRLQEYYLTRDGLQIGPKLYHFEDFKNFSIAQEGASASVVFMPLKRFMPPLTIHVELDMADSIVDFLSKVLPLEKHRVDAVDSLLTRIRF